jgi:hypothetical protein
VTEPQGEWSRLDVPLPVVAKINGHDVLGQALAFAAADQLVLVWLDPGTRHEREEWLPIASVRKRGAGESYVNR